MKIILTGLPGSGKGTQAVFLSQKLELPSAGGGNLFRQHLRIGTPLGLAAQGSLAEGYLMPDTITYQMIKEWIEEFGQEGYILEGYPRTLHQAQLLSAPDYVISLSVPVADLMHRLMSRNICNNCFRTFKVRTICCGKWTGQRIDDINEDTIHHRISIYQQQTSPIFKYYSELKNGFTQVCYVDGTGTELMVKSRILSVIGRS